MSSRQKILIGGLGALTPIILNLLIIDFSTTLENLKLAVLISYFIRVVVLFYLGGIVAFLHKEESNAIKLFELGIAAPALITAIINAHNIDTAKINNAAGKKEISSITFVTRAYAQTGDKQLKSFSLPEETTIEQIKRGLLGSRTNRIWFVIVGSHLNLEDAKKQAAGINNKQNNFHAQVYDKYADSQFYAVVIGANLTYEEAQLCRKKAIDSGLPKDTYLWTFPR